MEGTIGIVFLSCSSKRGIKLLGSMNAECIEFNVAAA